ncbi:F-box/FBD/LRR-repeat protein At1g16930-like [Mercurialis annua]|uniref:F-box/FBD/LRR-repeat protein At1g16930-like n=1 Tax=Mercurialis annua TaxID=3986 RepID=UPI00215DEEE2|nr:F-box/FBD/LRR-repeat protein At1g16930-like [Mercurialis annua]
MGSESKDLEMAYEDRISNLPNEIQCEILSRLSTKDAATTSVLSRCWRHKWTALADLDLHTPRTVNLKPFLDFVSRALAVRSFPSIKRFRLQMDGDCPSSSLKSWIEAAVRYKIEELHLCIKQGGIPVPGHLFRCGSVKVLKLQGRGCYIDKNYFPETICMPNLKILHLQGIEYPGDSTIGILLSCLFNLQELIIYRLMDYNNKCKTIHIQSGSLKIIKLHMWSGCYMKNTRVVVDAPKLEFLELLSLHCLIVDMKANSCSIVHVALYLNSYLSYHPKDAAIRSAALQFISNISSTVKVLTLSPDILQDIFDASSKNVPSFPNLNHLVLRTFQSGMSNLLHMLRILPNLKVLALNKVHKHFFPSEYWDDEQNVVPQCLNSSIERFEFKGYSGCSGDVKILEYIVRNAKALKEFNVLAFSSDDSEEPFK